MCRRIPLTKIAAYVAAGLFLVMVLSLAVTYAIDAGQMRISGQAFFVPQADEESEQLPLFPIDVEGDGQFIVVVGVGGATVHIISQEYIEGDLHFSLCTNNTNNGNTAWNMSFQFANPTVFAWTNSTATYVSPTPIAEGGIPNTNFTFFPPSVTPTTLTTGQIATVTLPIRAQLGRPESGGSATITINFDVQFPTGAVTQSKRVFFSYYPRNSAECPL